jgi:hypothetical protein
MIKILTHKSCCTSARLLRDKLAELTNSRVLITFNADKIRGKFIRYGNSDPVNVPDTKYNSAKFVKLVADKATFSKLMKDKEIYSPVYHSETLPTKFPVLIRKTLTSSRGKGIMVCPDKATFDLNWNPIYVWTPFIKTEFELRAHILDGKIAKLFKKVPVEENEIALPIRNSERGYHYQLREQESYPKVKALVKTLHPILDGSFYSLDIGWDKVNQKYLVFEANSGSGLNPQTLDLYSDYLVYELNNS